jgi:hypothetical protein
MLPSTRALLDRIVDYAGTFPPASLTLADALAEHARARTSDDAWLLGRFVVPAVALSELERLLAPGVVPDNSVDWANPWDLSVVLSAALSTRACRNVQRNVGRKGAHRVGGIRPGALFEDRPACPHRATGPGDIFRSAAGRRSRTAASRDRRGGRGRKDSHRRHRGRIVADPGRHRSLSRDR